MLSTILHGAVLLALTFEFSFPATVTHVDTIEVELVLVEPEREKVFPENRPHDETSLQQEDDLDDDSDQAPQTTTLPSEKTTATPNTSRPRSGDLAKVKPSPAETNPEAEEKKERAEPPQSQSEPIEPTELARLPNEGGSSLQEPLPLGEVSGCNAADTPTSTRSYIDQIAKLATSGRSYAQAAVHAQINGDYRKAIDLYDAAILARDLSKGNLAKVYNNRGAAYRSLGFHGLAIDDYNEAMRLKPDYAAAYFNRGIAHSLNDHHELAIADFTRSIRLNSGFAEPFYHRGVIFARQAKHELAISDFSHAIRLTPCLASAYFDRGRVFESTGDLDRAIDDFKKSYALDPNRQEYKTKLLILTSP